jgi:hypothetical protein
MTPTLYFDWVDCRDDESNDSGGNAGRRAGGRLVCRVGAELGDGFAVRKAAMTFADLEPIKRVAIRRSPSGKWVIFSVAEVDLEKNSVIIFGWCLSVDLVQAVPVGAVLAGKAANYVLERGQVRRKVFSVGSRCCFISRRGRRRNLSRLVE